MDYNAQRDIYKIQGWLVNYAYFKCNVVREAIPKNITQT